MHILFLLFSWVLHYFPLIKNGRVRERRNSSEKKNEMCTFTNAIFHLSGTQFNFVFNNPSALSIHICVFCAVSAAARPAPACGSGFNIAGCAAPTCLSVINFALFARKIIIARALCNFVFLLRFSFLTDSQHRVVFQLSSEFISYYY